MNFSRDTAIANSKKNLPSAICAKIGAAARLDLTQRCERTSISIVFIRQMPVRYAKGGRKMVRKTEMFEALPVARIEQLVSYELARPPVLVRGVGPEEFSEDIEPDLHRLLCEIRGQKEDEKMDRSLRTGGFKSVVITCNDGSTYEGRINRIEGCPFRADSLTVEAEVLASRRLSLPTRQQS